MLMYTDKSKFVKYAKIVKERHFSQTVEDVSRLKAKYASPLLGEVPLWSLIEKLSFVIDPTDKVLLCTSQWVHTLQVVQAMERDGVTDEALYVAAWLHDLGKILLLHKEVPENVVCDNTIIQSTPGSGLSNSVLQWNHDEFVYDKFKHLLPEYTGWLIRFHSINLAVCEPFFDAQDKRYTDQYLMSFRRYDKGSKSIYDIPNVDIDHYRRMLERHLPANIMI